MILKDPIILLPFVLLALVFAIAIDDEDMCKLAFSIVTALCAVVVALVLILEAVQ